MKNRIDGVFGIWTKGCRIKGTDESKDLWQPANQL